MMEQTAREIRFEVVEVIAVLSRSAGGYTTELNIVSFNGYPAKYDLRKWKEGKPLKGITLTADEAQALRDALNGRTFEEMED